MKVAVIGGGAAGFFAAISVKEHHPEAQVTIYEKSQKLLAKVKVSGGGRCNVTNGTTSISELSKAYPRGRKALKKLFPIFHTKHTWDWFEGKGVELYKQEDGRVFPTSNDSQTIIDLFLREIKEQGTVIKPGVGVDRIQSADEKLELTMSDRTSHQFDKVIVASGGSSKISAFQWLETLGHRIEAPVPSLFTFNMPKAPITELMGVVVENALVGIQGTKLKAQGPLLVTHWGMSGPAILKLSAFGARVLNEKNYNFKVQVNWAGERNFDQVMSDLAELTSAHPNKMLSNLRPFDLPERMWSFLLEKSGLDPSKKCSELGKKGLNKLVDLLTNDVYTVNGKTTFKEEFVTCGGVSLESVKISTMESKYCKGLYFAGEVLDIDGITGGYNFQAAWTTAHIAGKLN